MKYFAVLRRLPTGMRHAIVRDEKHFDELAEYMIRGRTFHVLSEDVVKAGSESVLRAIDNQLDRGEFEQL